MTTVQRTFRAAALITPEKARVAAWAGAAAMEVMKAYRARMIRYRKMIRLPESLSMLGEHFCCNFEQIRR